MNRWTFGISQLGSGERELHSDKQEDKQVQSRRVSAALNVTARDSEDEATAFMPGTVCVGAIPGRLEFRSWALARMSYTVLHA